jgi:hypothetical protein
LGVTEDDGSPADDGPACDAVGTVGGFLWSEFLVFVNSVAVDDVAGAGVLLLGLAVDKIGEKGCLCCRNGLARKCRVPQVDDEKLSLSF